jgi:hypothetical protein
MELTNNMLDYIIENKEWIFSGVGVFVLAGVIGLVRLIANKGRTAD